MIVKNDDKTPSETNRRKKLKMIILIVIVLLFELATLFYTKIIRSLFCSNSYFTSC